MAAIVYVLCALTSVACMVLLVRGYFATRTRLLLWASLGFCALAVNNIILVLDRLVLPHDLALARVLTALLGVSIMLYGCICDAD
jgi:hypothetical protein